MSPALLVLGDMSVQGNIKPLRSLTEPLQVAKDNGAKRALIPIENKRNFLDVQRRHRGARRPDLLRRPEDGGDEGAGSLIGSLLARRCRAYGIGEASQWEPFSVPGSVYVVFAGRSGAWQPRGSLASSATAGSG